jgi:hypothetical protein
VNLKQDMPGEIRRIAAFLDVAIDEARWDSILGVLLFRLDEGQRDQDRRRSKAFFHRDGTAVGGRHWATIGDRAGPHWHGLGPAHLHRDRGAGQGWLALQAPALIGVVQHRQQPIADHAGGRLETIHQEEYGVGQ